MRDQEKTIMPPIQELTILRRRVAELEAALAECKKAETALQEASTRGHQLFEYSGESIFIIDPDTLDILDANPIAARRLGYRRQELVRMSLDDIECPSDDSSSDELDWESNISGTHFYECLYRRKNSTMVPVEVSSRLMQYGQKEVMLNFVRDISRRRQMKAEREALIQELQNALAQVKTLSGLLPICANCKKVRDDQGYWHNVEIYVRDHAQVEFSHSICDECAEKYYPD